MIRKSRAITLSVAEDEKAQLEQLALAFDQTWGEKPNISRLLKSIAQGKLRLAHNHDWRRDRINLLNRALNHLKDAGHLTEALELAHLLLERSELNHPLRQEIQAWVEQPIVSWRLRLETYLRQHRPFRLTYQDAADRLWSFTIRHAAFTHHEERQYLDCWCDETDGNQDIEALCHNWSLRIDRIPDETAIIPVEGQWQPELSHIPVELHLLRNLAFGYRTKTARDLTNEWLPEEQVRRVVRRVENTFWFLREVRRYGADCVIIGPKEVRDRFAQEIKALYQSYQPSNVP